MSKVIPSHLTADFEEFLSRPDPSNMVGEVAILRTVLVELRESLNKNTEEHTRSYLNSVVKQTEDHFQALGISEEDMEVLLGEVSKAVSDVHGRYYSSRAQLSSKEAVDIARVVESLSKVIERYKKCCNGMVLRVDYDSRVMDALSKFVTHVVMRHVTLPQTRRAIADSARAFLPSLLENGPEVDIIDS